MVILNLFMEFNMNTTSLSTKQTESLVLLIEESSELSNELLSLSLSNQNIFKEVDSHANLSSLSKSLPILKEFFDFITACNFLLNNSADFYQKESFCHAVDHSMRCLHNREDSYNSAELAITAISLAKKLQAINNIACKCLRHGLTSYHPLDSLKTENIKVLLTEINQVIKRISYLLANLNPVLYNSHLFSNCDLSRLKSEIMPSKLKYLHHLTPSDI